MIHSTKRKSIRYTAMESIREAINAFKESEASSLDQTANAKDRSSIRMQEEGEESKPLELAFAERLNAHACSKHSASDTSRHNMHFTGNDDQSSFSKNTNETFRNKENKGRERKNETNRCKENKGRSRKREKNMCISKHNDQRRKKARSSESINTIQLTLRSTVADSDSRIFDITDVAKEIKPFLDTFGKYPIYRNKQNITVLLVCPQEIEAMLSTAEFKDIDLVQSLYRYDELVIWGCMDSYTILPKSVYSATAFRALSEYVTSQSNNPYNVRVKSLDLLLDAGVYDRLISISQVTADALANGSNKSKVLTPKSFTTFGSNVSSACKPLNMYPLNSIDNTHVRQRSHELVEENDQLHTQASSDGYRSFNVQPSDSPNGPIAYEPSFQNSAFGQAPNTESQGVSPVEQTTNFVMHDSYNGRFHGYQGSNHQTPQYRPSQAIVQRQAKPPRYPDYIHSAHRQSTYTRWPRQQPTPMELVNAGFFYTNQLDLVRCYQCGIGLKDFANSDDPMKEHIKHSGDCDFLLQQFGREDLEARKNLIRSQDPELNRQAQLEQLRNRPGPPNRQYNPRHPEYSTYEARLSSFSRWPPHLVQTPQKLAEAGLYYTGIEDHARCFACDGGLRKWDPEDDPWMEHCRWFPACPFAIQVKGVDFIELVQASSESEVNGATGGSSAGYQNDIVSEMNQLALVGTEFQRIINEHKTTFLQMGFSEESFNAGVNELRQQGNVRPDIEEIITAIEIVQKRQQQAEEFARCQRPEEPETPEHLLDENKRLKSLLTCLFCERNQVNALFLPCTHHKLCFECASGVSKCPICDRFIKQKIRTYMS